MSIGRTMTTIGFAIFLAVALSACGKKGQVSDPVDIFEISLPEEGSPLLRDIEELEVGVYSLRRLGFVVESGSDRAELRHDLSTLAKVSETQDRVVVSSNSSSFGLGFSVFLDEIFKIEESNYYTPQYVGYQAEVRPDQSFSITVVSDTDIDQIEHPTDILSPLGQERVARGVYTDASSRRTLYAVKTESGFSLYFVSYETPQGASAEARVMGRIDYLKTSN